MFLFFVISHMDAQEINKGTSEDHLKANNLSPFSRSHRVRPIGNDITLKPGTADDVKAF